MKILLLAVGNRMPAWVDQAFDEYARRMPANCSLELREIPAERRGKNADIPRVMEREARALEEAIPGASHAVALERIGRAISTDQLAVRLRNWIDENQDVTFLVGGPEGLSTSVLERADTTWSLSALTFAHPLVRVVLAEQLYRAWSICAGHPYHRGG